MVPANTATYPAAEIADALNLSKRAVQYLLEGTPTTRKKIIRGQLADAWTFAALPAELQKRLQSEAARLGFYNATALLDSPAAQWQPPIPLNQISEACLQKAVKLQRALAPSLARLDDSSLTTLEKEMFGVQEYRAAFGFEISTRHFRRLLRRTIERDRGAKNWSRIDIYMDERAARKNDSLPALSGDSAEDFRPLHELIANFRNPVAPAQTEEALLWVRSFELHEQLITEGRPKKKLKGQLLRFLFRHAFSLAKTPEALRVAFHRRFERWQKSDCNDVAVCDGRTLRKGESTGTPFDSGDMDRITWHAARNCGGRVAQAVREMIETDQLSPDLTRAFMKRFASKSYLPKRLRENVRHDVAMLAPHVQGPRAVEKTLAPLDLSYEGISSIECVVVDDFTWPVYFRVPDATGWWRVTRGQCILAIDFRTLCILSLGLQQEEQPNSLISRTVLTRAFGDWGIPKILYIERGKVFADSKLITGGPKARKILRSGGALSDAEVEWGLRQFGIEIVVARRARSKPVERVGGLLQDLMHGEPGYCGREERHDCPEETQHWQRELERKNPDALKHFYTFEEWDSRLWELCERYNVAQQDGKRLQGLSPLQAFEAYWPHDDPPTQFDSSCRFLLAHHKVENVEVKQSGIWLKHRGQTFRYLDGQTSALIGQRVTAWLNPETPEVCTFTDKNLRNAFSVARFEQPNALYFGDDHKAAVAKVHAHASYAARRYRVLKAKFGQTFRRNIVSNSTVELGEQLQEQQGEIRAAQNEREHRVTRAVRKANRLGIQTEILRPGDDEQLSGLDLIEQARHEHARELETKGEL